MLKSKTFTLQEIESLNSITSRIVANIESFLKNKDIPTEERWEVFLKTNHRTECTSLCQETISAMGLSYDSFLQARYYLRFPANVHRIAALLYVNNQVQFMEWWLQSDVATVVWKG